MEACTYRITENAVGLGQREVKGANKDFLFLEVGFPQIGQLMLQLMSAMTSLVW